MQILGADWLLGAVVADDDTPQASTQIGQGGGQGQDDANLAGRGDIESGLAGDAVDPRSKTNNGVAQGTVIDIDDATPRDRVRFNVELVALVQMVVDHGGKQVVGRSNGMEVTSQVQIELLHRQHLGVSSASGTALDSESWAHRRLA